MSTEAKEMDVDGKEPESRRTALRGGSAARLWAASRATLP